MAFGHGAQAQKGTIGSTVDESGARPSIPRSPSSVEGAQRKELPIIGDATMTEERTIIVRLRRMADGINVSGIVKYPVGDPNYLKVLNHLGGMNPGRYPAGAGLG